MTLLRADRRTLRRLTAAYAGQLRTASPCADRRRPRPLRLTESFWQAVSPSSPGLAAADPALARLDRLRVLRFNLLRAAWRTHSVCAWPARPSGCGCGRSTAASPQRMQRPGES